MAKILSLSIDEETERSLLGLERAFGFRNRSEALRASVRALAAELEEIDALTGTITAIAVAVHDDSRDSELDQLKHQFDDIVTTQLHNSFSGSCVELFVLNGPAERVTQFAKALKNRPNLVYGRLVTPSISRRKHASHQEANKYSAAR